VVIKYDDKEIEIKGFRNLINCVCGTTVLITDENNVFGINFLYVCKNCGKTNSFKYSIKDFKLAMTQTEEETPLGTLQQITKIQNKRK
jgi:hypothetical protein